ncbi:16S rRNA (uracil(1498)-N(3))-methyltransferase [Sinimarinibacterium thermocellulolyticum]|uniref:Ribosomal RNA small subunit methyltransferase E n=1 Tax=Sinimarinibacterium thermocellulolyticum TaxID=3170016 RepID=A0ABV2A5D8_9GAMM
MTRIHLPGPLAEGLVLDLPDAAFRHLVPVLRLREGDRFIAFDGRGGEYAAELVGVGKRAARARIGAHDPVSRESPLDLRLAQCVSKGERMDYTLQKAVELGVTRITPLLAERSVVRLDELRWTKKLDHWRGVIVSACEQSGRTRIPELDPPQPLNAWLAAGVHGSGVVLDPAAANGLSALPAPAGALTLLAGAEGGLSAGELAAATRAGFIGLRLGPRVLRTETAAVALLAALQARYGDWV